jgi:SAM-dependent methyltransferase
MTRGHAETVHDVVRDRYGEIARQGSFGGCCGPSADETATRIGYDRAALDAVPAGANLGLGCGAPLVHAALRAGDTVLDLGSGAGFDAFLAASEVGPSGRVIGVDMTDDMLARARENATKADISNVEFRKGYIEALPVDDASVDVIVSNCVINLVPDKAAVYREAARVLRPGGRLVVSDVVLDAPLPAAVAASAEALTGCIAGASLRADYLRTIADAGLTEIEVLTDRGFGSVVLDLVPPEMRSQADAAGVDIPAVAETVRSLTIRARKPVA